MLSAEGNFESSFWKERDIETKLEKRESKKMKCTYYLKTTNQEQNTDKQFQHKNNRT